MTTYTIKIKSKEDLTQLALEFPDLIMDKESINTFAGQTFKSVVMNDSTDYWPNSYSVDDSYLFLAEEIEWVKEE